MTTITRNAPISDTSASSPERSPGYGPSTPSPERTPPPEITLLGKRVNDVAKGTFTVDTNSNSFKELTSSCVGRTLSPSSLRRQLEERGDYRPYPLT